MQSRREGSRRRGLELAAFSVSDDLAAAQLDRSVRAVLSSWQLRTLAETTVELVSLLVAAATPHPRRRADVRLRRNGGVVRGEVSGSHLFPPDVPAGGLESSVESGPESGVYGRLPAVLAARSLRWGCDSSADGCTVWFELPVPGRASVDAAAPATGTVSRASRGSPTPQGWQPS